MISTSIKMGMAKRSLTTQQLADEMSVSRQTVSAWINGKSAPTYSTQEKLASLFGVSLSKFMEWGE